VKQWKRNAVVEEQGIHYPLLQHWRQVAHEANIDEPWLWETCHDWCNSFVCEFVSRALEGAKQGEGGLVLRPGPISEIDRMMCIAAAWYRMEKTSRVVLRDDVIEMQAKKTVPGLFGLLIPDFYVSGYTLTDRQQQLLYQFLVHRRMKGLATVVYIEDLKGFSNAYGSAIAKFVRENFRLEKQ
jgi:hypothetical protein